MVVYLHRETPGNKKPPCHEHGGHPKTDTPERRGESEKISMDELKNMGATPIISQNAAKVNGEKAETRKASAAYTALLRTWETDHANAAPGESESLYRLGVAIAQSVLKKCADPQRTTAPERATVSDNGNQTIQTIQMALYLDYKRLADIAAYMDRVSGIVWTEDGHAKSLAFVAGAAESVEMHTISDGMDVAHVAVVALLRAAERWADKGIGWLELPVTVTRINARVLAKDTPAAWETVETTPVKCVYLAIRRYIQATGNVEINPRDGYAYIMDYLPRDPDTGELDGTVGDALETVYRRVGRYADLGGGESDIDGNPTGRYTVDPYTVDQTSRMIAIIAPSRRQMQILSRRLQGHGVSAIASALQVTEQAVRTQLARLRAKSTAAGIDPATWREITGRRLDVDGPAPAADHAPAPKQRPRPNVNTVPGAIAAIRATSRDRDIIRLRGDGWTVDRIAGIMHMTPAEVSARVDNIRDRLARANAPAAIIARMTGYTVVGGGGCWTYGV